MKYFVILFLLVCMGGCRNSVDPEVAVKNDDDHPDVVTEQDAIRYDETDSLTRAMIIDSTELDTIRKKIPLIDDNK